MKLFKRFLIVAALVIFAFLAIQIGSAYWKPLRVLTHPLHVAVENDWIFVTKVLSHTPLIKQKYETTKPYCCWVLRTVETCSTPISLAIEKSSIEIIDTLLDNGGDKWTCWSRLPFHMAVRSNRLDVFKHLLEVRKIDPNLESNYPLEGVALNHAIGICKPESIEMAKLLLHHGADPNYLRGSIPSRDGTIERIPLLSLTISSGCPEITKLLLEYGADPVPTVARIKGFSPEHINGSARAREAVRLIEEAAASSAGKEILFFQDSVTTPSSPPARPEPGHPDRPAP